MGKRLSHQAEIERRHMQNGAWCPEGEAPGAGFIERDGNYDSSSLMSAERLKQEKMKAQQVDDLLAQNPGMDLQKALEQVVGKPQIDEHSDLPWRK